MKEVIERYSCDICGKQVSSPKSLFKLKYSERTGCWTDVFFYPVEKEICEDCMFEISKSIISFIDEKQEKGGK